MPAALAPAAAHAAPEDGVSGAGAYAASPAGLGVDIGRRHGLSPRSLGVVEGAEPADGLLEIVSLSEGRAELRPLDPTVDATRLIGARVRFVEAGFR
jgi:hypothetical protein